MSQHSDMVIGASLCQAIYSYSGQELELEINRIIKSIFENAEVIFTKQVPNAELENQTISRAINAHSYYVLSGKKGKISEKDLSKLNLLAELTAKLFLSQENQSNQLNEVLKKHSLHTQILDQIQESVITMDLAGFILSWNLGAEKLFGYTAEEAIGQNILFIYANEESSSELTYDTFLEFGGSELEVKRRKKSGEIFWANLHLSILNDDTGNPIGMIGYITDITDKKIAEERINHLAYYDLVTDLPNRTLFKKLVDNALQQSIRTENGNISIMFIDLNRFKPINDMLGHKLGNNLLKQVAERFRQALRENDVIARLGSDEFAVALLDMKQHFHAGLVAQKMLSTLEDVFQIEGNELRLGASIGISIYPQDGIDAESLLQTADIAMFKAKNLVSRNNGDYTFYSAEMNQAIADRLYLETGLRKALQRNEFFLQYQPKVDICTGKVIGAEALIRWAHPKGKIMFPLEFIPTAEESDLIIEIDAWVLKAACEQAKKWQAQGLAPCKIAVNVSAKEFTKELPIRIQQALSLYQLDPQWLEIEITESMLMQDTDKILSIMHEITAIGVSLALDDFGTGYSSLSYLKRFPISTLKIDRSFIQGIPEAKDDCAIASIIMNLAKEMNHLVVAEGVENKEQFAFLKEIGCDAIQGYFFAKPQNADQFISMLKKPFTLPILDN
jgi:diguanylate cyclase (GGDEF)-like protein/PAS domain S-box-containing protein